MSDSTLVAASDISKTFNPDGPSAVHALRGANLQVREHEFVALVGPSGSGKTTLLNLIGALDRPSSGRLEVLGRDIGNLSLAERARLRLDGIGFVFQAYNLLPVLTARENVELILEMQGVAPGERSRRAMDALGALGLADLAERRPAQMSGGQQQRVAVARSVASRPRLVLADEPTANLDTASAEGLMALMVSLHRDHGMTFIFSTHDPRVMQHAQRIVTLRDGCIEGESSQATSAIPSGVQPSRASERRAAQGS